MTISRTSVFRSSFVHLRHVRCRNEPEACGELLEAPADLLALPLSGVFARHDGPRKHVIANSNHALFFRAGVPYRLSFPEGIGDDCLTLEFPERALPSRLAGHVLLPPEAILQRSLFWRRLRTRPVDPLWIEESCVRLLESATRLASERPSPPGRYATAVRRMRQVEAVKEALSAQPAHAWTLDALAKLANASPFHLARVFRDEVGTPIHRYLMRARLAQALAPLLDSEAELSTIALEYGFASHSHFTASFRAAFGITPAALRRKAGGNPLPQLRKILTAPLH